MDRMTDDQVHQFLWEHSNHRGKLDDRIKNLAPKLGMTQPRLTERIQKLRQQGRVRKVKWEFWITDPAEWREKEANGSG